MCSRRPSRRWNPSCWDFLDKPNRALSRDQQLVHTRNREWEPYDRSIDSRVYRIRAKLGDDEGVMQRIRTVRNHGYVFCPVGW